MNKKVNKSEKWKCLGEVIARLPLYVMEFPCFIWKVSGNIQLVQGNFPVFE